MRIWLCAGIIGLAAVIVGCGKKDPQPAGTQAIQGKSTAEIFAEAKKLYDAKQYDQAAPLMLQAGEAGHAEAQMHLGKMYYNGRGVPHDHDKAVFWHQKAAAQGNAESMEKLKKMGK